MDLVQSAAHRPGIAVPETALDIAEHVLGRLPAAIDAEVYFHRSEDLVTDIHAADRDCVQRQGSVTRVGVRVWDRHGYGRASGTAVDVADVIAVAELALRRRNRDERPPFPAVAETGSVGTPGPSLTEERGRELAGTFLDAVGRVRVPAQTALVMQYRSWTALLASSGARMSEWHSNEQAIVRLEGPCAIVDAYATAEAGSSWDLDPLVARLKEAAAAFAAPAGAVDVSLPVVFRPAVAAPLVEGLTWLLRGTTALATPGLAAKRGSAVFPPDLNVADASWHPQGGQRRAFDDEGRATGTLRLIRDGHLEQFLHSTATAVAAGDRPNGRAFRTPLTFDVEPGPINLHVLPGGDLSLPRFVELTARKETLTTMPRAGLVSIIARGWVVEHGERATATGDVDLDLPLLPTLRRIIGVGSDLTFLPSSGCGTPSLLFPSLEALRG